MMKAELAKYNTLVNALPINDDFNIGSFWRTHESDLPAFSYVLRAVLANSPNSAPPERVFSILNDTFGDDQMQAHADYIELSLQVQYNARGRRVI